ncbi:hypothetical protein NQZ79_g3553 [Umbelopsis isabellina]|nr:hypothetical protein NQZ79_g3553 [Umbelopsis isabellina]
MSQIGTNVMAKLAIFTVAMFALPIITYYQTLDRVFEGKYTADRDSTLFIVAEPMTLPIGNATYAAGSAAAVANVILVAYIVAAALEDPNGDTASSEKKKED